MQGYEADRHKAISMTTVVMKLCHDGVTLQQILPATLVGVTAGTCEAARQQTLTDGHTS